MLRWILDRHTEKAIFEEGEVITQNDALRRLKCVRPRHISCLRLPSEVFAHVRGLYILKKSLESIRVGQYLF